MTAVRPGDLDERGMADLRKVFPAAIAKIEARAVGETLAAVQEHQGCACSGIEGHLRTRGLTSAPSSQPIAEVAEDTTP